MVDGDHLLLVTDPTFVEVCKRNMEGVVPLYYDAKKAQVTEVNSQTIYEGLSAAFSSTKIGLYSNSISKVWNSPVFSEGTEEEKKEALDTIKRLCMESNLSIDSAKTQYIVQRPLIVGVDKKNREVEVDWFTPIVKKYTGGKLPAFFEYAKDKKPTQVEERNGAFVNRIYDLIPNPRIDLRHIEFNDEFDYHKLMKNPRIVCSKEVSNLYDEEVSEYKYKIDSPCEYEKTRSKNLREIFKFRELGYSDEMVADMLVQYTFGSGKRYKQLLWFCYGEIVYQNLYNNLYPEGKEYKIVQCKDCNEYIEVDVRDFHTCRCFSCREEHKKKLSKMRKRKQRRAS